MTREGLRADQEPTRLASLLIHGRMGRISNGTGHRLGGVRRRARDLLALAEMIEDALHDHGFGDEPDHPHFAPAARTHEGVDFVDAPNKIRPSAPEGRAVRPLRGRFTHGRLAKEAEGSAVASAFLRLPRAAFE